MENDLSVEAADGGDAKRIRLEDGATDIPAVVDIFPTR